MGTKRPSDAEFKEFPIKQAKQIDFGNQLTIFQEVFTPCAPCQDGNVQGQPKAGFGKLAEDEVLGNENIDAAPGLADKELETSAPLSWVTSSSSEENGGSGEAFYSCVFPEFSEVPLPRRTIQFGDAYTALMNSSPRKEVPIGPDHQADLPTWDPSGTICSENEKRRIGTCIMPMPSSTLYGIGNDAVRDRAECGCLDDGSIRCVRQHVQEAREKLRETIGDEKFAALGFFDMGEEVANNWTAEEEGIFHEVVYSNPCTLGRNFWKHLKLAFPLRTMKEIVSYYFNVFMLRTRAVQNRSSRLDVDSDDDEWHGDATGILGDFKEDEGSVIDSIVDRDVQVNHEDSVSSENDDDDAENDDEAGDDSDGGDSDIESGDKGPADESRREQMSKLQKGMLQDDLGSNCEPHFGNVMKEEFGGQEDLAFLESKPNGSVACGSGGVTVTDSQPSRLACSGGGGSGNGSGEGLGSSFVLEPCDAKVWDHAYMPGLVKGVDLLPTCNMIEEIFGSSDDNTQSSGSKSV